MDIVIDLNAIINFFTNQPPWLVAWEIFWRGGWAVILLIFLFGLRKPWLEKRQKKFAETISWTLLAIDVPRENLQTLLAVEQVFANLAGTYEDIDFWEKWWEGKFQISFSFEIVSLDGYIQFLVRTPQEYRDLIEASVFAHYPDAEIVEVHDYTHRLPHEFPNETHDLWAGELILAENTALPLRTHKYFEDKVSGEIKDPIAPLLEVLSKLQHGEELWMQFVLSPNDGSWKEEGHELVNKLIGAKPETKKTIIDHISDLPMKTLATVGDIIFIPPEGSHGYEEHESSEENKIQYLTPGQKDIVAAAEEKISKTGFDVAVRVVYIARKEIFAKARVTSMVSAFRQFSTLHLNSFKIGKKVSGNKYWRKKESLEKNKTHWFHEYAERAPHGSKHFVMNVEELATVWHFPVILVKTPLIQKTEAKKAEPPFRLPVEITASAPILKAAEHADHNKHAKKENQQKALPKIQPEEKSALPKTKPPEQKHPVVSKPAPSEVGRVEPKEKVPDNLPVV